MRPFTKLSSVLVLLAANVAYAGGDSFAVKVVAFERVDADTATFQLQVVGTQVVDTRPAAQLACTTLTVLATYGPPNLEQIVGLAKAPSTRESHRKALDALALAYREKVETRFGLVSDGLSRDAGAPPCEFRSRALRLAEELGGRIVPYSYERWP